MKALTYIIVHCRAAMVEGKAHPDPIVETASLASVRPPKPNYVHHLQVAPPKGLQTILKKSLILDFGWCIPSMWTPLVIQS